MSFPLQSTWNVTLGIAPGPDAAGNPTSITFDAGSVTATFPETTNLTAVVAADQNSILVTSEGPLVVGDVLSIAATVNGSVITADFPIDVTAGPATSIVVTPGTPVA